MTLKKWRNMLQTAIQMIWRYKHLPYEERWKSCGLTTLQRRRRGDLINAYQIITGKEAVQWEGSLN